MRNRYYYTIPQAGRQAGWGRSESYRRADSGDIPTERISPGIRVVPRKRWDAKLSRLLRKLDEVR
jgi:hypothetical protein